MISEEELYNIISNDIVNNFEKDFENNLRNSIYLFKDFIFEGLTTLILLGYHETGDDENIVMICNCEKYSKNKSNSLFSKKFNKNNILEMVDFLFKFRKDYSYSKIIDRIIKKDDVERLENRCLAIYQFSKNKEMDKCCVCFDANIVLTKCRHNLCRLCFENIKYELEYDDIYEDEMNYKLCPMCRTHI
jgi:hypothetical protein